jgi:hypothetical protein
VHDTLAQILACLAILSERAGRQLSEGRADAAADSIATAERLSRDADPGRKRAATVHHLSCGRPNLGVGAGWVYKEYRYLGADFRRRGKHSDVYIKAIRELWASEVRSWSCGSWNGRSSTLSGPVSPASSHS